MLQLPGEPSQPRPARERRSCVDDPLAAHDPEHIKPAQRIETHESIVANRRGRRVRPTVSHHKCSELPTDLAKILCERYFHSTRRQCLEECEKQPEGKL